MYLNTVVETAAEVAVETAAEVARMAPGEVTGMIGEALKAMGIGVAGVFAVLAIFFVSLKVLMARAGDGTD
jgi:hypothetical protein